MTMEFKSGDMTRITGVKLARLQQWWAAGYIGPPSVSVAQGAGTRNVFSTSDLFRILFFKRFIESGIPRNDIKKLLTLIENKSEIISKSIEVDTENFKRYGDKKPAPGTSEMYAVFYRQQTEVIKFKLLIVTDGKASVPDEIRDADDFIGINIQKIFRELFRKITE